jgi:hypothetical protein
MNKKQTLGMAAQAKKPPTPFSYHRCEHRGLDCSGPCLLGIGRMNHVGILIAETVVDRTYSWKWERYTKLDNVLLFAVQAMADFCDQNTSDSALHR